MRLDIAFVVFNSEKWIDQLMNSIVEADYDLKELTLLFYDNNSSDASVSKLYDWKEKKGEEFNEFKIIKGKKNEGFGIGNNKAISLGTNEYIFILNVDTRLHPDTFKKIQKEIESSDGSVAMWELCQCPYEHPKYYDPITHYVSWASAACMVVKRKVFEKVGGFDKNTFMYCEDVDLSWSFRKQGYNIKYLPTVEIDHFSYNTDQLFKYNQFLYSYVGNWYLRAKYGTFKRFAGGTFRMWRLAMKQVFLPKGQGKQVCDKIQKDARKIFFSRLFKYLFINIFRDRSCKNGFEPTFYGDGYEINGTGAFSTFPEFKNGPLVSIIVRTHNRPGALREALTSIRNQTYQNIETIVVEDGDPVSEELVRKEFGDLNIHYYSTGTHVGRCVVGNIGLEKANGRFINFLDDDDALYPKHVEVLAGELERKRSKIAYSSAFETQITKTINNPGSYEINNVRLWNTPNFSKIKLYDHNFLPIQTVMFSKELYLKEGGFDTNVDALEDWDLWIRYSLKSSFLPVNKTTSVFRVPFDKELKEARLMKMGSENKYLNDKFLNYIPEISVADYRLLNK